MNITIGRYQKQDGTPLAPMDATYVILHDGKPYVDLTESEFNAIAEDSRLHNPQNQRQDEEKRIREKTDE